jgi:type II secretory pathway component PulF
LKVIGELPDECRLDKDIQLGLVSFLAPLLDAGLPLVRALDVMERGYRQSGGTALAQVARDLVEQIRTGSTFSEALARHPEFDSVALSLVKAGELGGVLEITLAQLRDWMLEDYRRLGYAA